MSPYAQLVNAERLKPRGHVPGLIKAELGSVEEKVAVLRRKQVLCEEEGFSRVYIISAKYHAERHRTKLSHSNKQTFSAPGDSQGEKTFPNGRMV